MGRFNTETYLIDARGVTFGPVDVERDRAVQRLRSTVLKLSIDTEGLPPGTYSPKIVVSDALTGIPVASKVFPPRLTIKGVPEVPAPPPVVVPEKPGLPTPAMIKTPTLGGVPAMPSEVMLGENLAFWVNVPTTLPSPAILNMALSLNGIELGKLSTEFPAGGTRQIQVNKTITGIQPGTHDIRLNITDIAGNLLFSQILRQIEVLPVTVPTLKLPEISGPITSNFFPTILNPGDTMKGNITVPFSMPATRTVTFSVVAVKGGHTTNIYRTTMPVAQGPAVDKPLSFSWTVPQTMAPNGYDLKLVVSDATRIYGMGPEQKEIPTLAKIVIVALPVAPPTTPQYRIPMPAFTMPTNLKVGDVFTGTVNVPIALPLSAPSRPAGAPLPPIPELTARLSARGMPIASATGRSRPPYTLSVPFSVATTGWSDKVDYPIRLEITEKLTGTRNAFDLGVLRLMPGAPALPTPKTVSQLTSHELARMPIADLSKVASQLTSSQIKALAPTQLKGIISKLSSSQLDALTPAQVKSLSVSQLKTYLSPAQLKSLLPTAYSGLLLVNMIKLTGLAPPIGQMFTSWPDITTLPKGYEGEFLFKKPTVLRAVNLNTAGIEYVLGLLPVKPPPGVEVYDVREEKSILRGMAPGDKGVLKWRLKPGFGF